MIDHSNKSFDVFGVPLEDENFSLGYIIKRAPQALDSLVCVFTGQVVSQKDIESASLPSLSHPIAIQFVTDDCINEGYWPILSSQTLDIDASYDLTLIPEKKGSYVDVRVIGCGILRKFLNAWHGLDHWDRMKDPNYYDHLLWENVKRPEGVIFTKG